MTTSPLLPPSLEDVERLAQEALGSIPEPLRAHIQGVVIRVEDFPDEETEREMELESPYDLLGLYRGIAVAARENPQSGAEPDMIFLYRRPLLDFWCEEGTEDFAHLIRHVMIHEIGHHFGFSDDDMESIEASEAD